MSFSALKSLESCPLRWALGHAQYVDLWSGKGYPAKTRTAAIVGQVIHGAVEAVVKEAKQLTGGVLRARMIQAVRERGGFSALIEEVLAQILKEYAENPRMSPLLDQYKRGRTLLPPTVRTAIQSLLKKVAETSIWVPDSTTPRSSQDDSAVKALSNGLYTEMPLYASHTNWYGKIDLLSIDED